MGCGGIKTKNHPLLSKDSIINVVFWSKEKESSMLAAQTLINGTKHDTKLIWTKNESGVELNGYIRYLNNISKETPKGITDVLIALIDDNESEETIEYCKQYINSRKDIPFRYLVGEGEELMELAKTLSVELITSEKFLNPSFRLEIIDNAKKLDFNLKNVFCEFDINQNGFISADELTKVSKRLKTHIQIEEARKIAYTIDPKNGNIQYEKFKYWWLIGKDKFTQFRNTIKKQISVENLAKGTDALNRYLIKMQQEEKVEKGLNFIFNLISANKFETGTSIKLNLLSGENCKDLLGQFSEKAISSPISFGVEISVLNPADPDSVIKNLQNLKKEIFSMVPFLNEVQEMGLDIIISKKNSLILVEIIVGSNLADEIFSVLSELRFSELNVSANSVMEFQTELKFPFDLVSCGFDTLFKKFLNFKFETNFQFSKFSSFVEALKIFTKSLYSGYFPRNIKSFFNIFKFLQLFSKCSNENIFEPDEALNYAKDLINQNEEDNYYYSKDKSEKTEYENLGQKIENSREEVVNMILSKMKMFIKAYYDNYAVNLNFDKISGFMLIPNQNILFNANLNMKDFNESLKNLLN